MSRESIRKKYRITPDEEDLLGLKVAKQLLTMAETTIEIKATDALSEGLNRAEDGDTININYYLAINTGAILAMLGEIRAENKEEAQE